MEGTECLSTLLNTCIALPRSGALLPLLILAWLLFRMYQTIRSEFLPLFSPYLLAVYTKLLIENGQVPSNFPCKTFGLIPSCIWFEQQI